MKAKVLVPIIFLFIVVESFAKNDFHLNVTVSGNLTYCNETSIHTEFTFNAIESTDIWGSVTATFPTSSCTNFKWYQNQIIVATNHNYTATDTGKYGFSCDVNGFPRSFYVCHITRIEAPIIRISNDTLISSNAQQYQWYCNNQLINGATSQTYIVNEYGNYKVVATTNECSKSNEINYSSPFNPISDLTLFPNPSRGSFTAKLPTGTTQIEIVNTLGELIENKTIETQTTVDITLMNDGIYFISAVTVSGVLRKKVVVSR